MKQPSQNHFYEIARPLIERGLSVIPLHPKTKTPAVGWKNFRIWNLDILAEKADAFAKCDVAAVSSRGIGRPMFIDFDDESVIPRIETETGKKIPATFKVCSRPSSAPLRQHHIWSQTAYGIRKFKFDKAKNINIRDVTNVVTSPSGGKMFKTLYDLKGIGGSSYIVGAGSIHTKTGDTYSVIDDSPIAPIPDWLVDWLVKDIACYRRAWKKMNAKKESQARKLVTSGQPEVAREDLHDFVLSVLKRFSAAGLVGDLLQQAVITLVRQHVQGGNEYVESERGRTSIHNRVTAETANGDIGIAFYHRRKTKPFDDAGIILLKEPTKRDVLQETISSFPDRLTVEEARSRIVEALSDAGMKFDGRGDKNSLSIIRERNGFATSRQEWFRQPGKPSHSPSSIYDEGRDKSLLKSVDEGQVSLSLLNSLGEGHSQDIDNAGEQR